MTATPRAARPISEVGVDQFALRLANPQPVRLSGRVLLPPDVGFLKILRRFLRRFIRG